MTYRNREFIEDIDSSTRVKMSDTASIQDYSSNSREGWVLKALFRMGPSSISGVEAYITSRGGPSKAIDSIWTMLDEGTLEIA